jgi:hypothetical protein
MATAAAAAHVPAAICRALAALTRSKPVAGVACRPGTPGVCAPPSAAVGASPGGGAGPEPNAGGAAADPGSPATPRDAALLEAMLPGANAAPAGRLEGKDAERGAAAPAWRTRAEVGSRCIVATGYAAVEQEKAGHCGPSSCDAWLIKYTTAAPDDRQFSTAANAYGPSRVREGDGGCGDR